jgi:hypothetical protein
MKHIKLFENFQLNEGFMDKVKTAFGIDLKIPSTFEVEDYYRKVDISALTPEQKDVMNKIIMVLNDLNKNVKNSDYMTKLSLSKVIPGGFEYWTHPKSSEQDKNFEKALIAKGLKVRKKSESRSTDMGMVGDYSPTTINSTTTTWTVTQSYPGK